MLKKNDKNREQDKSNYFYTEFGPMAGIIDVCHFF